jgi:Uma2 family endonuclease
MVHFKERPMGEPALKTDETFTYRQYKDWPEDDRWELIHGVAWAMSAPRTVHQRLLGRLYREFANHLGETPCEPFLAPFDVLLADDAVDLDDIDTVVQPDLVVVCDKTRLLDIGYRGGPALVVEILSPSTSRKDLHDKFSLYETFGVKEYWVVDPAAQTVTVFRPGRDGKFDRGELKEKTGTLASRVFEGLAVDLTELFAEPV